MRRARRAEQKRDPEGSPRGKRATGGLLKPVVAAISKQLSRALAAWHEGQAAISKQLTASLRAWVGAASNASKSTGKPAPAQVRPPAPSGMEGALQALRAGTMTFAAFDRATVADWDRLATMLFKRWPLPAGVEVADVRQELLLAVVRRDAEGRTLLQKWERASGVPLARYVTWNAIVWASRWIHDQRGVYKTAANAGSRGRDPGNIPRPLSSFEREDGSSAAPDVETAPDQGELRACEEMLSGIVAALRSSRDRALLAVYLDVGGSVREAAAILARDARLGLSERQAREHVVETLERTRRMARRVMAMQQAEA